MQYLRIKLHLFIFIFYLYIYFFHLFVFYFQVGNQRGQQQGIEQLQSFNRRGSCNRRLQSYRHLKRFDVFYK